MATFKDTAGREWEVKITAGRLTRLRELLGYSVAIVATPEGVAEWRGPEVTRDPERFGEVLAILLAEQFKSTGITRDAFEEAFDEDAYRAAGAAFKDALMGFSQVPDALREIFRAGDEAAGRPLTSSNGVMNSPEPPASTPETTASAP